MPSRLEAVRAALTAALTERDIGTRQHCDRVGVVCKHIGSAYGISPAEQVVLQLAASFHDIGKIGIPDAILLKPASLTSEEWAIMRTHPERGERIFLATQTPLARQVATAIRHHHESYDGNGYPDRLQGNDIPLLSRILAVADAYDAMATTRPYRAALPIKQIERVFSENQGIQFDPLVTEIMIDILMPCTN